MSSIGRIFIVLNLGLAAAFLGWAANALHTTDDYKAQFEAEQSAHAAAVKTLQDDLDQAKAAQQATDDDLRARTEAVNTTQAEADKFKGQMEEAKRTAAELQSRLGTIADTLKDYNATIAQMSGQKDDSVQRANEAENERDDAVEAQQAAELAQAGAEENSRGLEQTIADLNVDMVALNSQHSSLETQMQMLIEYTGVSPEMLVSQPLIEGRVLEASAGLVMLNVGDEDMVKRGFTFEIYNGGTYKAQVRVVDVQGSVCSAVILHTVDGTTITQGDAASTRI
ncbi:MAG: hypothetical protein ACI9K5_003898 [Gammaproteobacteria bacterium]|jgi:hypothetical protein